MGGGLSLFLHHSNAGHLSTSGLLALLRMTTSFPNTCPSSTHVPMNHHGRPCILGPTVPLRQAFRMRPAHVFGVEFASADGGPRRSWGWHRGPFHSSILLHSLSANQLWPFVSLHIEVMQQRAQDHELGSGGEASYGSMPHHLPGGSLSPAVHRGTTHRAMPSPCQALCSESLNSHCAGVICFASTRVVPPLLVLLWVCLSSAKLLTAPSWDSMHRLFIECSDWPHPPVPASPWFSAWPSWVPWAWPLCQRRGGGEGG